MLAYLFVVALVAMVGCEPPQTDYPSVTQDDKDRLKSDFPSLTQDEKEKLVEIALNTAEAKSYLREYTTYRAEIWWQTIIGFSPFDQRPLSRFYKDEELSVRTKPPIPKQYMLNPAVLLRFGDPKEMLLRIPIHRETGKVMMVQKLTRYREPVPENSILTLEVGVVWGASHSLYVTADGRVTYIVTGDRHLSVPPGGEPTRTKSSGNIEPVHIERLMKLLQDPLFAGSEYKSQISQDRMTRGTISFSYRGIDARILTNYNPLTFDFVPREDIPP